jgi:hypothetical protein
MFRINCTLSSDIINSDLFFNYQDNLSKKSKCKYDILDSDISLGDLKNIRTVLNKLKIKDDKPIIIKGIIRKRKEV